MTIELVCYRKEHDDSWDGFCLAAENSTFLQTRRFLSYHGDRFDDHSLLIRKSGKIVGLFPAAADPKNGSTVVSHPGITYGSIVHHGKLVGSRMIEALEKVCEHYASIGFRRLQYKAVPYIYSRRPAQDDIYALFRLGAGRVRCELSACIDLAERRPISQRRRRGLRKASQIVALSRQQELLPELWMVVEENLASKHGARPVHSFEEINGLMQSFPENVLIRSALIDGKVEAGVVIFRTEKVWHAQYIAASAVAYDASALDAVFESAIIEASEVPVRYFDFGTSNDEAGWVLNDGLYRFKTEFGAGGVCHEYYELEW